MILTQSIEDFPGKTDIPKARETASRHICCWFSLDLRFWTCKASTIIGVHALKSVSPLISVYPHSLSLADSSSLLFYFVCMCCMVYACICVCMVSCAFVWMCVEVRGQCQMSFLIALHFFWEWLSHWPWSIPIQQDYLSSSSWYSPVSASPVLHTGYTPPHSASYVVLGIRNKV